MARPLTEEQLIEGLLAALVLREQDRVRTANDEHHRRFEAAVKELDKELSKTIKNVKTTSKSKEDKHNGMAHFEEAGTGEVDGVTIAWSVDVLGAKKPLIILTFAAPNLFEKHADEYMKLVGSIKKID